MLASFLKSEIRHLYREPFVLYLLNSFYALMHPFKKLCALAPASAHVFPRCVLIPERLSQALIFRQLIPSPFMKQITLYIANCLAE